ncbi:MAG: DUF2933 domain-containing protein [Desulforhopalus sp.]|jgi:hypothetical protein
MSQIQQTIEKLNGLKWPHVFFVGVAFGGAFLVWDQFSSQIGSYLPYLILLLCPLMHVFLHRGQGNSGHSDHPNHKNETDSQRQ